MHGSDPVSLLLVLLTVVLLGAKLGGEVFERLGLPAVLGELLAGVLLGNVDALTGLGFLQTLRTGAPHEYLRVFAQIGAVILLFDVGLQTRVAEMLRVGVPATIVATAGVIVPWVLGYGAGVALLPEASFETHLFLGAILTATSVGITARILRDLGKLDTSEARIILGAAVIDDVLGLIVLSVVGGLVKGGRIDATEVTRIIVLSAAFLFGSLLLGSRIAPYLTAYMSRLRGRGMKLITGLAVCFVLAWMAAGIGLAPIVGAFAAGMILEEATFKTFREARPLRELLEPFSSVFVPIFFVVMGIEVDLRALGGWDVAILAGAITAAAILGKQICGLVVPRRGLDRLTIGFGMVPRGEVGLIFASVGHGLGVVNDALYAACILMVILTTFVTPPLLQWSTRRRERAAV